MGCNNHCLYRIHYYNGAYNKGFEAKNKPKMARFPIGLCDRMVHHNDSVWHCSTLRLQHIRLTISSCRKLFFRRSFKDATIPPVYPAESAFLLIVRSDSQNL